MGQLTVGKVNNPTLVGVGNADGSQYTSLLPPPAPAQTGNTGGYSAPAYSAPAIDYAKIAQLDQQINFLKGTQGNLDSKFNSGNQEIDASFQNAINQLLAGRNQTEQTVNTTKKTLADQYVTAKNTIGAQAGQTLSGLQRLLGSRGAGGSSTAKIVLPGAVARNATIQRGEAQGTNAKNLQGVDQQWGQYLLNYDREVNSATAQKNNQKSALQRQIDDSRATLLQQIAQLAGQRSAAAGGNGVGDSQGYLNAAQAALARASSFSTSPINYNVAAYQAPTLDKFVADNGGAPTVEGQAQGNDYTSPYLAALLGPKKQQTLGV